MESEQKRTTAAGGTGKKTESLREKWWPRFCEKVLSESATGQGRRSSGLQGTVPRTSNKTRDSRVQYPTVAVKMDGQQWRRIDDWDKMTATYGRTVRWEGGEQESRDDEALPLLSCPGDGSCRVRPK